MKLSPQAIQIDNGRANVVERPEAKGIEATAVLFELFRGDSKWELK